MTETRMRNFIIVTSISMAIILVATNHSLDKSYMQISRFLPTKTVTTQALKNQHQNYSSNLWEHTTLSSAPVTSTSGEVVKQLETDVPVQDKTTKALSNDTSTHLENIMILPIYPSTGGPSTVYNLFRWTLAFALYFNYSLVTTPFETHRTDFADNKGVKLFNETFDEDRLSQFINVVPLANFITLSNSTIKDGNLVSTFSIMSGATETKELDICSIYRIRTCNVNWMGHKGNGTALRRRNIGVSLPATFRPMESCSKDISLERNIASPICLGNIPTEPSPQLREELHDVLDKALIRAPYIRHVADSVYKRICNGKVAVVHWRNKSGECSSTSHGCTNNINYTRMEMLRNATRIIVNSMFNLLKEHNIRCIYVAKPVYEQEIVNQLVKTSLQVYESSTLYKMHSAIRKYRDDNYVLSLVEQEIAEMADLFISSRTSNWSYFVEYTRRLRNMKTIGLQELPGVPPELIAMPQTLKRKR